MCRVDTRIIYDRWKEVTEFLPDYLAKDRITIKFLSRRVILWR